MFEMPIPDQLWAALQLEGFQRHVETQLLEVGAEIISAGLVDSHPSAQVARPLRNPKADVGLEE